MNDELTPEPSQPAHRVGAAGEADAESGAAAPAPTAHDARSGPDTEPQSLFGPPSAGGMIRNARQAQGIDVASLAAMLKVPLRRIEALENGRHEELQGPTFERALAQAACRVLKIDPKPVLALLPQHERNTLDRVSEGINTPFRDGHGSGGFELPNLMRPAVLVFVVLVALAIALFVVPDGWLARVTRPFTGGQAASAPADAPASAAARGPAAMGTTTAPVELPAASVAASAPAPVSAASTSVLSPAVVSATAAQGIDEVLAHVAGAPSIPLQVTATADSWVEVVDAQGHSLLSRTVVAGESVGLDGALPMRVKIGNAAGTHLKLRGDNVDLTPFTHDNVARLELK